MQGSLENRVYCFPISLGVDILQSHTELFGDYPFCAMLAFYQIMLQRMNIFCYSFIKQTFLEHLLGDIKTDMFSVVAKKTLVFLGGSSQKANKYENNE